MVINGCQISLVRLDVARRTVKVNHRV